MKTSTIIHLSVMAICLLFANPAKAQIAVESERIDRVVPTIDGDLSDWTSFQDDANQIPFTLLGGPEIVEGGDAWENQGDYSASIAFAHDKHALYFAATVQDDTIVSTGKARSTEDHIELRIALLKGKKGEMRPFGLGIFADPETGKIEVRKLGKKSSKVLSEIEAAIGGTANFFSYEVRIPWSSLPLSKSKHAGMRAAVFAVDCDDPEGKFTDTVIGTAPITARNNHKQLPLLGMSDVTRPLTAFWKEMKLSPRLTARYFAALDLTAGAEVEQAIVAGKYLMAYGSEIENKDNYAFIKLPVESPENVIRFEYFDATGDSKKDILLEFEVDDGTEAKRWISIYSLDENQQFQRIFSAATLIDSMIMRVENDLRFVKGPNRSLAVRLTAKKTKGLEKGLGDDAPQIDGTPMVVPWDKPSHVTYTFLDGQYIRK